MSTALVVLGMHRSGTSALTGALHLLGVPLGGPLVPPGPDNERGFWELLDVVRIHEELLRAFGASHLNLDPLPAGWKDAPASRDASARLRAVVRREFAGAPLFALKDPRLAVLLPLWDELFAEMGIDARFVITHRAPWEIARSLAVRNGTSVREGISTWERHVSAAERLTRGRPRVFTSYDRLLADATGELQRIASALGVGFPKPPAEARAEIGLFLSPALRSWKGGEAPEAAGPELVRATDELAAALDEVVDRGESPLALERLERAAAAVREAAAPPAPPRCVLFVSHDASRTGAPLVLLRLARWLREHRGVEPRFVLRAGGPLEPEFRALGDTLVAADGAFDPRFTGGVSLVWANTATSGPFLAGLSRDDLPVVTHVHELPYALDAFGRAGMARLLERTTRFVACSGAVAKHLVEGEGVAPGKVVLLHSAIDAAALAARHDPGHAAALRSELGLAPGTRLVVGAGTADWRKGADLFLHIARAVTARRDDVAFLWVGGASARIETVRLHHDLDALGRPPRIRFLGEREDPVPVLDAADLFLLTSREDPFPLVMLESAALGKPCVCFEGSGGAPELCREAGRVVPYLDLPAMERAVEELLDDEPARARLGEIARTRTAERYDIAALGAGAAALIEELALVAPPAAAPPAPGREPAGPLPDAAFRAEWVAVDVPRRLRAGDPLALRVTVKNVSPCAWPDDAVAGGDGRFAVRLGWRWRDASGNVLEEKGRQELPREMPPGGSAVVSARIPAPSRPGTYTLQLDLLQELVAWFETKGAPRLEVPVDVRA